MAVFALPFLALMADHGGKHEDWSVTSKHARFQSRDW